MRKLLVASILGVVLSIGGCGGSLSIHNPSKTEQETPIQKTAYFIDQLYATHASVTTTLLQNYKDGIITKEEKDNYAKQTRQVLNYIDRADTLLSIGDVPGARAQAELAKSLIAVLQQELARQAAKEKH